MAFASAITFQGVRGSKKISKGTWTTDTTTGDIDTGLTVCEHIALQYAAAAVIADAPTLDETLPVAGSAVTIIVTSGADGLWEAEGY